MGIVNTKKLMLRKGIFFFMHQVSYHLVPGTVNYLPSSPVLISSLGGEMRDGDIEAMVSVFIWRSSNLEDFVSRVVYATKTTYHTHDGEVSNRHLSHCNTLLFSSANTTDRFLVTDECVLDPR